MATENLIINYFRAGFTYNEIADILSSRHGTNTIFRIPTVVGIFLKFRNFNPPPPPQKKKKIKRIL